MIEYNERPDFYYILIGVCMLNDGMARDVADSIEPEWMTTPAAGGNVWHSLAISAIKMHWKDHRRIIDPSTFRLTVMTTAARFYPPDSAYGVFVRENTEWFIATFMPGLTERSLQIARDIYKYLLQRCKFDVEAQLALSDISRMGTSGDVVSELSEKLSDLCRQQRQVNNGYVSSGIGSLALESIPRSPTGVDFLDARWGRGKGPTRRTACGIFMPMGGGKTTLGNQISISQALMGKPAIMVIAEQGMDADYYRRVAAMATGIPSSILEDNHDDLRESARAAGVDYDYAASRWEAVDKHLSWIDVVEHNLSFEQVEDAILRVSESSTDKRLEVGYIDWAMPLAQSMVARGYRGRRLEKDYDALGCLADAVARLAQENELFLAISQQIRAEDAGSPYADLDQYCPLGNRMFGAPLRNILIVQRPCARTKVQIATIPKSRNDPVYIGSDRFVLKLDGDRARFDESDDFVIINSRIRGRHQDTHGVPKE